MIKKILTFITVLSILFTPLVYAGHEDTLTYRRDRASRIELGMLDLKSGAQRVISVGHSVIHNYQAYSYSQIDTLADGEFSTIAIMIPDGVEFHLKSVDVWSEKSPNKLCVYAHPDTIALSADTITAYNRNQDDNALNIAFTTESTLSDSVLIVSGATCLDPIYFGGGTTVGNASLAGSAPNEIEWIFNDTYIYVTLENLSGATSLTSMSIFWYELPE